jgi:hypothetical protein
VAPSEREVGEKAVLANRMPDRAAVRGKGSALVYTDWRRRSEPAKRLTKYRTRLRTSA